MKSKIISILTIAMLGLILFVGCTSDGQVTLDDDIAWKSNPTNILDDKYRTYYEVFLYSYCDSNGDGIGDINGLISKLDYIKDLGMTGIWLMPVMESPSYHKYDTIDYMTVDKQYGSNQDFKRLIDECHERNINVIIDLAMNHTSVEHPWFAEAYSYMQSLDKDEEPDSAECKYVDYYNFKKTNEGGYSKVEGTDWMYEAQFVYSMPDLNLENKEVQKEFEAIAKNWLDLGVDGFRLDAVKYFEIGDTQACVNTLKWFNDYVKGIKDDAYIVCECWDTQNEYAKYYASGVDSMFDFAFADKNGNIAKAVLGKKTAVSLANDLEEEEELYSKYSDSYINAPFYTNHDMGRSAGYYPGDDGLPKVKMAEAINILTSGNVFLYYGEELGMKGSGIDENKRAPMLWSDDKDAAGMCKGPENMEVFDMKYGSLESQIDDGHSMYNFVKDAVLIRNQNPEIARGITKNLVDISNDQIAALEKTYGDSKIYLIFNLSSNEELVELGTLEQGMKIVGALKTDDSDILLEQDSVSLPAYSVVVLKE